MSAIIRSELPDVFNTNAVRKHGVVYAETRRDLSAPLSELSGSMSVQEYAGDIPLVLSDLNYERAGATMPFQEWTRYIEQQVSDYDALLKKQLGLHAIGYPNPVHGIELLDLDKDMSLADINVAYPVRPKADATVLTKLGYASCIAPADCVVVNAVDTVSGVMIQSHAGYVGNEKNTIGHTFQRLDGAINPKTTVAYMSPHAQDGYVINLKDNGLVDRFEANPVMAPHVVYKDDGVVEFNLTAASKAQLVEAGIPEENIQISEDNTMTDPTLYSQSSFFNSGTNGRNGMIFGKSSK